MGAPSPLARLSRREVESWPRGRITAVRRPAVHWTGAAFAPCWITGYAQVYAAWYVRLRTRRDAWRDREAWYAFDRDALIPVEVHPVDLKGWLPRLPD